MRAGKVIAGTGARFDPEQVVLTIDKAVGSQSLEPSILVGMRVVFLGADDDAVEAVKDVLRALTLAQAIAVREWLAWVTPRD